MYFTPKFAGMTTAPGGSDVNVLMLAWLFMWIEFVLVMLFRLSVLESGAIKFILFGWPLYGCV